jgi:hypothetical protein
VVIVFSGDIFAFDPPEIWVECQDLPGCKVSDRGRVMRQSGRIAKLVPSAKGYSKIVSRGDDGRVVNKYVHRLVLAAFTGPCPAGMFATHLNGDPSDNRLINLRWRTQKDNIADKRRHGTYSRLDKMQGRGRFTEQEVESIRTKRASGMLLREIAAEHGVSVCCVSLIANGARWATQPQSVEHDLIDAMRSLTHERLAEWEAVAPGTLDDLDEAIGVMLDRIREADQ